jgi:hypothetical protein
MSRIVPRTLALAGALLLCGPLAAQEFRVEDVAAGASASAAQLKPKTILFGDRRVLGDPATALTRFEDWERGDPVQKRLLSLYPAYAEPTIKVTLHGVTKPYKEKLHVYVASARFLLSRPIGSVDLGRYANLGFIEKIDPTIKHTPLAQAQVIPLKDPEEAHNRSPEHAWCDPAPRTLCIQSRYAFEGKFPTGIRLANKLEEGGKKIDDFISFQSELRLLPPDQLDRAALTKLTGFSTPIGGAIEQNIFHVNQVMQFGKLLAVTQEHPNDPGQTIVTAFLALGVETDVLEKKKDFENVPVLRNLVPIQVLLGNSSFNTGTSMSAGLPVYARNRMKAIAALLERE